MRTLQTLLQAKSETFEPLANQPPPLYVPSSSSSSSSPTNDLGSDSGFLNLNDKVSPSMLLVIIILAIVFFISGLIHLLVRFLWRPQPREAEDLLDNVSALQGQLQQLFHLHDSGVDQSFIDSTLPVFHYKAIIGIKDPFDCAVCLCEFEPNDKLRLLPKCSHAFHMDCIDTWLLSHSTCPLCRASLLSDFSPRNTSPSSYSSPFVYVLESGSDSSREIVPERESHANNGRTSSVFGDIELGLTHLDLSHKSVDLSSDEANNNEEKVVTVKLGKFRNVDSVGEGMRSGENMGGEARRCLSMGSFAYVMDDKSSLQVPVRATMKKQTSKKPKGLPLTPGRRIAMSECDCESMRDFKFTGFETVKGFDQSSSEISSVVETSRKESYSVSKIWLRGKQEMSQAMADSSRRAVSFRFSGKNDEVVRSDLNEKNEKYEVDDENQSCYSVDSQGRAPSFARRTLLWLTGKQNKVVHSSYVPNL